MEKIIGHYLLKSKYLILQWCGERNVIDSRADVKALEDQLLVVARETDVKLLPAYASVPSHQLLADIRAIQQSLEDLMDHDKATYKSSFGTVELNGGLVLSNDLVLEVLTREIVESNGIRIVQVKKPDYLGRSQWSFRYDGHKIEAAIHDKEWLGRFQSRLVDVRPGDSLKVDMHEKIYYGYEGEIVHRHYAINGVIDVIRPSSWSQVDLF